MSREVTTGRYNRALNDRFQAKGISSEGHLRLAHSNGDHRSFSSQRSAKGSFSAHCLAGHVSLRRTQLVDAKFVLYTPGGLSRSSELMLRVNCTTTYLSSS